MLKIEWTFFCLFQEALKQTFNYTCLHLSHSGECTYGLGGHMTPAN